MTRINVAILFCAVAMVACSSVASVSTDEAEQAICLPDDPCCGCVDQGQVQVVTENTADEEVQDQVNLGYHVVAKDGTICVSGSGRTSCIVKITLGGGPLSLSVDGKCTVYDSLPNVAFCEVRTFHAGQTQGYCTETIVTFPWWP